jgi:hypothetical protein
MTAHLKWFEIFRSSGNGSEGAYVRTHSGDAAIMRNARRCGGDPENFYAVEVAAPNGRAAV